MGILKDKVVVITGATSGIGAATAIEAAKQGAKVVLAGRREEQGVALVATIRNAGGTAMFVRTDVTDEKDVEQLVARTVKEHGGLDGAFNNAGALDVLGTFDGMTTEDFQKSLDLNLRSIFLAMKYQIPEMKRRQGGYIVNCGSVGSKIAVPGFGVYITAKHAIIGMTKAAAVDYAADGIRVNAVLPGPVATEIWDPLTHGKMMLQGFSAATPFKRHAHPSEIAKPVVFLLSEGASYITGTELLVDGGFTCV